jgi:hypothetical protein
LRYLYETERPPVVALPRGPGVVKGTAVHGLVEAWRGREAVAGLALKQDLCARLANSLGNGEGGVLAKHAFELHGLHAIFTRSEIVAACQFVGGLLARYGMQGSRLVNRSCNGRRAGAPSPFGNEVWLEDAGLDLAGRADLVFRALDESVHIVDFKSSRTGADAGLRDQYILQLVAYAVLVERKVSAPRVVVELATSGGVQEVEVDDGLRNMALSIVASVTRRFPRGLPQAPSAQAVTGSHCASCAYRVSCAPYVASLSDAGGMLPVYGGYDLAGIVTTKEISGGMASLVISRTDGAPCRLDGVPEQTWPDVVVGSAVLAFDVRCREMAAYSRVAANFFVFRPDDRPASAYRALLHAP